MPVPADLPGHLWSTATPIAFSATGAAVPPIPLVRAAGPVVLAARFTRTTGNGAIISLGGGSAAYFDAPLMLMFDWDTEMHLRVNGGVVKHLSNPMPPSGHTVIAIGATSASLEDIGDPPDTGALGNPAASATLHIGHGTDASGNPWFRAGGTLHRAALFARDGLTTAERAEVLAWLADEGGGTTVHDRGAAVAAVSTVSAWRTAVHARSAQVAASATVTASRTIVHARGAAITAASGLTALVTAVRSRAAAVQARSAVTAARTARHKRGAAVEAGSALTVARTAVHARGAAVQAASSLTAAATVVHSRGATVNAVSTVAVSTGNVIIHERGAAVVAEARVTAGRTAVHGRSAAVVAETRLTAARTAIHARAAAVAAAAVLAAGRTAIHARSAAVRAVSAVTVIVSGGPLVPVRFAYPGEARAGRLIHEPRAGTLLGGPRTGTLLRG